MKEIELMITLKPQVLDTKGEALNRAVKELGYGEVYNIRVGKTLFFDIEENEETEIDKTVASLAERLFTNTVIETYEYKMKDKEKHS